MPYEVWPVDIFRGTQLAPEFLAVAPNKRIPALTDDTTGKDGAPFALFESGAILCYLAETVGRFMPTSSHARHEVQQWVFWQMARIGPMMGQAAHFLRFALVQAMLNSLQVGLTVTLLCILLGVPTALVCVRGRFSGKTALSVFVMVPHMVPGIVLGVAVLFAGALVGVGPSIWLQSIAITVFVLAVMVRTVMSRLQRLDPVL